MSVINAFSVTGGSITRARRLNRQTLLGTTVASRWELSVEPTSGQTVTLSAPGGRSCSEAGALCTAGGQSLSHSLEATIPPPVAVADDCSDDTSTTCEIRVAGSMSGAIEAGGDQDWIRTTGQPSNGLLTEGHRYMFRVNGRGTISNGAWLTALESPIFEVLDSTGASLPPRVAYESSSGSPEVEFVAGATQVYYVAVSSFVASTTGGYMVGTMNTTSATVAALLFTSDPGADDTYSAGDEITVRVMFTGSAVETSGTPQLALVIGATTRQATCAAHDNYYLECLYTVVAGDSDTDGISIRANSVTKPNGATIRWDGMDIPLYHDAVPADSGHKVDSSATVQPVG